MASFTESCSEVGIFNRNVHRSRQLGECVVHRCENDLKTRRPLGIADNQAPRPCFSLAISRELSHHLNRMCAGGIMIRQRGSFKIGDDFPAVVQVEEIVRHWTPPNIPYDQLTADRGGGADLPPLGQPRQFILSAEWVRWKSVFFREANQHMPSLSGGSLRWPLYKQSR